jgi:RNA polymerase sigma factor (sigma-70 family)
MATAQLDTLMRHLKGLAAGRQRTDRQLLEDFTCRRDESAFAGLVGRHGPMVLRVCRRVLRQEQDAEDAFQATFLVLARSTASIHRREALASWLYGVAYRTAMNARRKAAQRRNREARLRERTPPAAPSPTWDDVQAVLDEEIQRLPGSFRAAFVSCVLDGKTVPAAAAELGVKEGTLSWRLMRARQQLRQRLVRRGIQLSAVLAALSVAPGAGKAAVPAALARVTVGFGLSVAAGEPAAAIPSHVAALAAGVTRAMSLTKAKIAVVVVAALGLFVLGAGVLACQAPAAPEPDALPTTHSEPAAAPEKKEGAAEAADKDKDAVTLRGQVLDPDGKPVTGAKLYLLGGNPKDLSPAKVRATTDRDGRFSLTATRDQGPLFAVADGYGPAWTGDFNKPDGLALRLVKDDVPITGRIIDLQGKPVAGVTLRPHALKTSPTGKLDSWLEATKVRKDGGIPLEYEQLSRSLWLPKLADVFPRVTTDADGRFQLKGVGRERVMALIVEGPTVETQEINVATRAGFAPFHLPSWGGFPAPETQVRYYPADFQHVSPPCRPVAGVVRDRATGKPIAGAVVRAEATVGNPFYRVQTTTDAEGRYRLTGLPKGREGRAVSVLALPPDGQAYMGMKKQAGGGEVLETVTLDFPLKKGVWVQGRVTDKATGRGVQAVMEYSVFLDSLDREEARELFIPFQGSDGTYADKQGNFRFVAYPGRGLLGARATGPDMWHYRIGVGAAEIKGGQQFGGQVRFRTIPLEPLSWNGDAWKEIDPAPGAETMTCDFSLEPGRALQVRVEGPDGKPLEGAQVHGQHARQTWFVRLPAGGVIPAEFPLYGLEEGKGRTLLFRHPGKGLAGLREIKGDESGPVVVRLQPAASVRGRLLNDDGLPWRLAEVSVRFTLKELPGLVHYHGPEKVQTDADGRFRIDGLVPGMKYGAMVIHGQYARELFTDLRLASGEAKDLGDVTPKKARDAE